MHGDGWFDEEHDGAGTFRWIGREATCRISTPSSARAAWLRVTAEHPWPPVSSPVLSVAVDGCVIGRTAVGPHACDYLFPLQHGGDFADVRLSLDRTFTVPGDPRSLGVIVRALEAVDLERADVAIDAGGWYAWERHSYFDYRWMAQEARLLVPAVLRRRGRFAAVPMYGAAEDGRQTLRLLSAGEVLLRVPLLHDWHLYDLILPDAGDGVSAPLDLTFSVDTLLPADAHPGDGRDLGLAVGALEIHDDARRHERFRLFYESAVSMGECQKPVSGDPRRSQTWLVEGGEGWYDWELEDRRFRWIRREARVRVPEAVRAGRRFIVVPICSEFTDLSQVLTVAANGEVLAEQALLDGWNEYGFDLAGVSEGPVELAFRVNKAIDASHGAHEPRELGARVGAFTFHDDAELHARTRLCYENAALNRRELDQGATELASFPVSLGIDLFGKCNIKPPCVYCLWDRTKEAEGDDVDVAIDDRTLEQYADFFCLARTVVNCSFGEPLLHPRLSEILDLLGRHRKSAEISTNGQSFTPAAVTALAGRNLAVYVSLDAASAPTYARLRNERWHEVLTGLMFLRDARRKAGGLPRLNMVFMPMRANLSDLEGFFRLCRMVDADAMVLRPLNYLEHSGIVVDRGGYHFDYDRELLTGEEQEAVFQQCERYAKQYRVRVISQFDFQSARRQERPRGGRRP